MAGLRWVSFMTCLLLVTLARWGQGGSSRLRLPSGRPGLGAAPGNRAAPHSSGMHAMTKAEAVRQMLPPSPPLSPSPTRPSRSSSAALLPVDLRCVLACRAAVDDPTQMVASVESEVFLLMESLVAAESPAPEPAAAPSPAPAPTKLDCLDPANYGEQAVASDVPP